ncbi:MAG TPA: ABC transporter permease [Gemmatimonadaceae bacterium]|nr:ABC transporter permease [Gemmatimonadaceae bacterium]
MPSLITAVRIGLDTLRVNPLRTALSTLGIIIGVASLVAVLALGDGMEAFGRREVERTTDVQAVGIASRTTEEIDGQVYPRHDYPVFTEADAIAASRDIAGVAAVHLVAGGRSSVEWPVSGKRRMADVSATLATAADFLHLRFAEGRYFTDVEASRNAAVVIVSHRTAAELTPGRHPLTLLGREVRVGGTPRTVIGILEPYEAERGYSAFVPLSAAATVLGPTVESRPPQLMVKAASMEDVEPLRRRVEDWLGTRYGRWEPRVQVTTSRQRLAQVEQGMLVFKGFMGAITGISLLVGGIGIMNVLLAAVTERTREIGVRKALGARRRDILLQFLVESVAISGAGSAAGVVLGLVGAFGLTALIRSSAPDVYMYAAFSWGTVLVAALSAIAVGLIFGTYPARRAARLSPIDAIRHE